MTDKEKYELFFKTMNELLNIREDIADKYIKLIFEKEK